MTAAWLSKGALCFDLETTGVDVFNDRIVTASAIYVGEDGIGARYNWYLKPGVPIPAEASAVHGITSEQAAHFHPPAETLPFISATLTQAWREEHPVIICNAHFDLTMLQAELARYGLPPLVIGPVLDPLVIDRAIDPYRKGSRKLDALARHYGVEQTGPHTSDGDALTAARVVWKLATHPKVPALSLTDMQEWQRRCHAEWAGQFEVYLRQKGKPEVVNREWPVRNAQ